ncbi:hypothetical protein TRFO_20169 [Tritrichomonas foetus]|uniref:U3 small nucleolar RNA-associated protein 6 n=1 Tax=Tritrichomonas foetus TaxID=1144522 RepID=A0A1J4KLD7_9EUKA|nr:hypothetical protein TRFO_20169 [Tritrichomonas foetus]|eukprot:OHT10502.1 hypothetical protein TRFO_20169 [Tritrichomonas foetus]
MGEKVEQRLEQFVPTFEQLIKVGIYSQPEVKEIVRKRRSFEYSLQSKSATLDSYLKYIQYESAVMELTEQRKIEKGIDSNERLLSDTDWPRHINSIFRLATQKFSGDLKVWNLYFDFCLNTHSFKNLSRAFAECVRLHSHSPELWIRAATWEMNDNGNTEYAKSLMEQAIKQLPDQPKLYATYAETILHLAEQIKGRREIHGITEESDTTKAPLLIYAKALSQCPDKSEVYVLFQELFKKYDQPVEELTSQGIETGDPSILDYIAQKSEDPIAKYHEFIEKFNSRGLKIKFAHYLGKNKNGEELVKIIDDIDEFDDNETEIFVEYLINCNCLEDAEDLLQDDLTTPKLQRLKLKLLNAKISDNDKFISESLLLLTKFNTYEMNSDFLLLCARRVDSEKWMELVKSRVPFNTSNVIAKIFEFSYEKYGSKYAKDMLTTLLPMVNPTPEFIKVAIKVEESQDVVDPAKVRALHDLATSKWGSMNEDVWLDYCQYEYQHKNIKKLEEVRFKANKALIDASEFTRKYQERFCKKSK